MILCFYFRTHLEERVLEVNLISFDACRHPKSAGVNSTWNNLNRQGAMFPIQIKHMHKQYRCTGTCACICMYIITLTSNKPKFYINWPWLKFLLKFIIVNLQLIKLRDQINGSPAGVKTFLHRHKIDHTNYFVRINYSKASLNYLLPPIFCSTISSHDQICGYMLHPFFCYPV